MANEICASGFGNDIDGQYELKYRDHWSNGKYWIYRDSFYWMISTSEFLYYGDYLVATKPYNAGEGVDGNYDDIQGDPYGTISLGTC